MPTINDWVHQLKKRGLDPIVLSDEQRAEKEKQDAVKFTQQWQAQDRKKYINASLWGEETARTFHFSDWLPEKQPNEQKAKEVGNQAYRIMRQLSEKPFNVFLNGEAGTGKTSLALAIMDGLGSDYTNMFVSVIEWRDKTYQSFHDDKLQQQLSVIEKYMRDVDVLILDDFGKETQKEAKEKVASMLFRLADARKGKTTIITSNDNELALTKKYDMATLSRLIPSNPDHVIDMDDMEDVREV
ncbi:Helicase loader DnaI [Weissella jogaejeotgali]|uniref:Helicase loader DnaI n=1 Tax=Weissella jogaejeotgali TaxID=1631871 RepID=A0A1L6R9T2_9LACO|nr:ATP-binding protein [Weissella jogaejeotgali]APS41294.1 Helicase loader DnaI [Weissella jogaejeotgali]